MDFYKLRSVILAKTNNYLELRQDMMTKQLDPPKFSDFERKMMLEFGATKSMLKGMIETLAPGVTVENGEIVKKP